MGEHFEVGDPPFAAVAIWSGSGSSGTWWGWWCPAHGYEAVERAGALDLAGIAVRLVDEHEPLPGIRLASANDAGDLGSSPDHDR